MPTVVQSCVMPDCLEPASGPLCVVHVRRLAQNRLRAEALRIAKIRKDLALCYRLGCLADVALYASGRWCDEHAPRPGSDDFLGAVSWPAGRTSAANPGPAVDPLFHKSYIEPILGARPCPLPQTPLNVKAAIKTAQVNGWEHHCTIAIGPEPEGVHSVLFRARKDGVTLESRHEGDGTKSLSFKAGWIHHKKGLPTAIGWRELMGGLAGTDPLDVHRQHLRDAVFAVMDIGGDIVRIDEHG